MPAAEVELTVELVRALVAEQFPDLVADADDDIEPVANGWDNGVFRLGSSLTVRLPRRAMAAPLVDHEQRWLPELAPRLPLPIPVPLRAGVPSAALGYPWPWSVCPWFEGIRVAVADPPLTAGERTAAALVLGRFVAALAAPAPADAPHNPYRGVPLAERDQVFRERVVQLSGGPGFDAPSVLAIWQRALDAPAWDGPPVWLHGDLHPANVVLDDRRPVGDRVIAAVLDFGDLAGGDPATDLSAAWMFLPDPAERARFRAVAGPAAADDATWTRARGWALSHAIACLANSADEPVIAAMAARTLAAVLDPDQPV
jgi:aminoglycoside phosphotransferase (APT) family kinase protein